MNPDIVLADGPVLLVGGGDCPENVLKAALSGVDRVVAADGGALPLLSLGRKPDAVIGDMDSLPPEVQAALPPGSLHRIDEQDSTDFDKALRHISAPLVLGYGFLGKRLDHQLAAMTVLAAHPDRRCILVGAEDVVMLAPPELALDLPRGNRLSLYPLGPVTGRSEGLRWPIDGLALAPDGVIGTSNAVAGPVRLWIDAPRLLLILPLAALAALQAGLAASPARWPARAG